MIMPDGTVDVWLRVVGESGTTLSLASSDTDWAIFSLYEVLLLRPKPVVVGELHAFRVDYDLFRARGLSLRQSPPLPKPREDEMPHRVIIEIPKTTCKTEEEAVGYVRRAVETVDKMGYMPEIDSQTEYYWHSRIKAYSQVRKAERIASGGKPVLADLIILRDQLNALINHAREPEPDQGDAGVPAEAKPPSA